MSGKKSKKQAKKVESKELEFDLKKGGWLWGLAMKGGATEQTIRFYGFCHLWRRIFWGSIKYFCQGVMGLLIATFILYSFGVSWYSYFTSWPSGESDNFPFAIIGTILNIGVLIVACIVAYGYADEAGWLDGPREKARNAVDTVCDKMKLPEFPSFEAPEWMKLIGTWARAAKRKVCPPVNIK